MSIINIISDENVTLVQGVYGICLCEESWIVQGRGFSFDEFSHSEILFETEASKEENVWTFLQSKKEYIDVGHPHPDLLDLT